MSAALDEKNQPTNPASFACLLALTLVLQLFNLLPAAAEAAIVKV
jgi:hypothetical protein